MRKDRPRGRFSLALFIACTLMLHIWSALPELASADPLETDNGDGTMTAVWGFDAPGDYNSTGTGNVTMSNGEVNLTLVERSWVQTSKQDFDNGTMVDLEASPPGNLTLNLTPWTQLLVNGDFTDGGGAADNWTKTESGTGGFGAVREATGGIDDSPCWRNWFVDVSPAAAYNWIVWLNQSFELPAMPKSFNISAFHKFSIPNPANPINNGSKAEVFVTNATGSTVYACGRNASGDWEGDPDWLDVSDPGYVCIWTNNSSFFDSCGTYTITLFTVTDSNIANTQTLAPPGVYNYWDNTSIEYMTYIDSGTFESEVFDATSNAIMGDISWVSSEPAWTNVTVQTRTANASDMSDASSWVDCTNGGQIPSPNAQFIQYRAILESNTTMTNVAPTLNEVSITYWMYERNGSIETEDLVPASVMKWGTFSHEHEQNGQSISYFFSNDSGANWHDVPIDGDMTGIGVASGRIRFRVELNTSDTTISPTLLEMCLTYVGQNPSVVLSASVNPTLANPGDTLNYTIIFNNVGGGNSSNVTISCTLDADLAYLSDTSAFVTGVGSISLAVDAVERIWAYTFLDLQPGAHSFNMSVRLGGGVLDGAKVRNRIRLTYTDPIGITLGGNIVTVETICQAPDLLFDMDCDRTLADFGETIRYVILIDNIGAGKAKYVWVNDTLDPNVVLVSGNGVLSGGKVEWAFVDLQGGESRALYLNVTLNDSLAATSFNGTVVSNIATLEYVDPGGGHYTNPALTSLTTAVLNSNLTVEIGSDTQVAQPGDWINYTVYLNNTGLGEAQNVKMELSLTNSLDYLDDNISSSIYCIGWWSDAANNTNHYNLSSVVTGNYSFYLNTSVKGGTADGSEVNSSISLSFTDPIGNRPSQRTAEMSVDVHAPAIEVEMYADRMYTNLGDDIQYTIYMNNTGQGSAMAVWINCTLDSNVTYASSDGTLIGNVVQWNYPYLADNSNSVLNLNVTVNGGITNGTIITSPLVIQYQDAAAFLYELQVDSAVGVVLPSNILLEANVDKGSISPGESANYTIFFNNTGSGESLNVTITCTLDIDLQYQGDSSGIAPVINENVIDYIFLNVEPGPHQFNLTVIVAGGVLDGVKLRNRIRLRYTDPIGRLIGSNNVILESVATAPDILVEMVADSDVIDFGDVHRYVIRIDNIGAGVASEVWVNDTLDPTFDVHSTDGTIETGMVRWQISDLPGETSIQLFLNITLNDTNAISMFNGTIVTNTAEIEYLDTGNGHYDLPDLSVQSVAVLDSEIDLGACVDRTSAEPGEDVTYAIYYNNTGLGEALEVVLDCTFGAGLTYASDDSPVVPIISENNVWYLFNNVLPGDHLFSIVAKVDGGVPDGSLLDVGFNLSYTDPIGRRAVTAEEVVTTLVHSPVLSLSTSTYENLVDVGDRIQYIFYVNNSGQGSARSVWVNDTLDPHVGYHSSNGNYGDGRVTWSFSNMVGSSALALYLNVTVLPSTANGTLITNAGTMEFYDRAGFLKEVDSNPVTSTVVLHSDVSLEGTVDEDQTEPGDNVTYRIYFNNSGQGIAQSVEILVTLAGGLTYIEDTSDVDPIRQGQTVRYQLTNVQPGPHGFLLVARILGGVGDGALLVSEATLDFTDPIGRYLGGRSVSLNTTCLSPHVTIEKSYPNATADIGEPVHYLIFLNNTGNGTAKRVIVNNTFDDAVNYVNSSNGGELVGNNLIWTFYDLQAHSNIVLHLNVSIKFGTPDGTIIDDATIMNYSDGAEHVTSRISNVIQIKCRPVSAMEIQIFADIHNIHQGDKAVLVVYYNNMGTGLAEYVWINYTIPSEFSYISSSIAYYSLSGDIISWKFNDVQPGIHSFTITLEADKNLRADVNISHSIEMDYMDSNERVPIHVESMPDYIKVTIVTTIWEKIYWPWSGLIILLAAVLIGLVLRKIMAPEPAVIDEIFLIYRDGRLIAHKALTERLKAGIDEDIMSTMLTAIQQFVKDSFADDESGIIKKLEFGDRELLIERGKNIYIAVLYTGFLSKPRQGEIASVISDIEAEYPDLEDWNGYASCVRGVDKYLERIITTEEEKTEEPEGAEA